MEPKETNPNPPGIRRALDCLFDAFAAFYDKEDFTGADAVLARMCEESLPVLPIQIGVLTITGPFRDKLPSRARYRALVAQGLKDLGRDPNETLLQGL